jgi:hypothetical protein
MDDTLSAFRERQSAKLRAYAEECSDPELKEKLLQMSASWLAAIKDTAQSTIEKASTSP